MDAFPVVAEFFAAPALIYAGFTIGFSEPFKKFEAISAEKFCVMHMVGGHLFRERTGMDARCAIVLDIAGTLDFSSHKAK